MSFNVPGKAVVRVGVDFVEYICWAVTSNSGKVMPDTFRCGCGACFGKMHALCLSSVVRVYVCVLREYSLKEYGQCVIFQLIVKFKSKIRKDIFNSKEIKLL